MIPCLDSRRRREVERTVIRPPTEGVLETEDGEILQTEALDNLELG